MSKKRFERGETTLTSRYRAKQLGAIVLATALMAGVEHECIPWVLPPHEQHVAAASTHAVETTAPRLDLHVLAIDDPTNLQHTNQPSIVDQRNSRIKNSISAADKLLTTETYGKYGVNLAATTDIVERPRGWDEKANGGKGEACYSFDQLTEINKKYADGHHLNSTDGIIDLMTSTHGCPDDGEYYAGVYFDKVRGKTPQLAFQPDYLSKQSVLLHELGHVWGLGHMSTIACLQLLDGNDPSGAAAKGPANSPLAFYDVNYLADHCGVVKQAGNPKENDQYYSYGSVMGSEFPAMFPTRGIYSTPEFNKLDPKDYPIEKVTTEPGVYQLSQEPGALHGISIALPADHPLRTDDTSLREITFTINAPGTNTDKRGREVGQDINVIATGGFMSYEVETMSLTNIPSVETIQFFASRERVGAANGESEQWCEPLLYMDKSLGIIVTGGRDAGSGEAYVRVSRDDTEWSKQKIAFFKSTVAERNKMIVAHNKAEKEKKTKQSPSLKRVLN